MSYKQQKSSIRFDQLFLRTSGGGEGGGPMGAIVVVWTVQACGSGWGMALKITELNYAFCWFRSWLWIRCGIARWLVDNNRAIGGRSNGYLPLIFLQWSSHHNQWITTNSQTWMRSANNQTFWPVSCANTTGWFSTRILIAKPKKNTRIKQGRRIQNWLQNGRPTYFCNTDPENVTCLIFSTIVLTPSSFELILNPIGT